MSSEQSFQDEETSNVKADIKCLLGTPEEAMEFCCGCKIGVSEEP